MLQIRAIRTLSSCARVIANISMTAAGSGDNTEGTGSIIDRYAIGTPQPKIPPFQQGNPKGVKCMFIGVVVGQ